jgi:hypothetical protein
VGRLTAVVGAEVASETALVVGDRVEPSLLTIVVALGSVGLAVVVMVLPPGVRFAAGTPHATRIVLARRVLAKSISCRRRMASDACGPRRFLLNIG